MPLLMACVTSARVEGRPSVIHSTFAGSPKRHSIPP